MPKISTCPSIDNRTFFGSERRVITNFNLLFVSLFSISSIDTSISYFTKLKFASLFFLTAREFTTTCEFTEIVSLGLDLRLSM